jgi:protein transport protein SEC20
MASSPHLTALSRRLDALTETYKQTLASIHKIPRTPDPEDLSDLTSTIRDSLNSLTEDLDILNLSLEDVGGARPDSEESRQKLRLSVQAQRLGEDIRNARQSFRRTQIHVRRTEDAVRRREREERLKQLREPPRVDTPDSAHVQNGTPTSSQVLPARRKREEKQTEDDLLLNASSDVLGALRQTHALMASEVERSHFAAEILANSSRELEQLGDSYTDIDSMLKISKGLVTQLMKSNKSDTWYLLSARTFLLVVAAWLVWRRLLWGPTWWLLWLPLKVLYMTMMVIVSPLGVGRSVEVGEPVVGSGTGLKVMPSASEGSPRVDRGGKAPNIKVGRGGGAPAEDPSEDGSLSQKVGRMAEEAARIVRGDGTELEDSDEPRNAKKRVLEARDGMNAADMIDELEQSEDWQDAPEYVEVEAEQVRDEL